MAVKSVVAVVMVLASTAACSASVDDEDTATEPASGTVADSLSVGDNGGPAPAPLDYPVPVPKLGGDPAFGTGLPDPTDALRGYIEEMKRTAPDGRCVMRILQLDIPGGAPVQIPIVECH